MVREKQVVVDTDQLMPVHWKYAVLRASHQTAIANLYMSGQLLKWFGDGERGVSTGSGEGAEGTSGSL
uniref:Catalase peroxidase n=1 Tax=Heterorhabditis bacteriophora TaxID=37862 RepID=A0A1I7X385_HETBA